MDYHKIGMMMENSPERYIEVHVRSDEPIKKI